MLDSPGALHLVHPDQVQNLLVGERGVSLTVVQVIVLKLPVGHGLVEPELVSQGLGIGFELLLPQSVIQRYGLYILLHTPLVSLHLLHLYLVSLLVPLQIYQALLDHPQQPQMVLLLELCEEDTVLVLVGDSLECLRRERGDVDEVAALLAETDEQALLEQVVVELGTDPLVHLALFEKETTQGIHDLPEGLIVVFDLTYAVSPGWGGENSGEKVVVAVEVQSCLGEFPGDPLYILQLLWLRLQVKIEQ